MTGLTFNTGQTDTRDSAIDFEMTRPDALFTLHVPGCQGAPITTERGSFYSTKDFSEYGRPPAILTGMPTFGLDNVLLNSSVQLRKLGVKETTGAATILVLVKVLETNYTAAASRPFLAGWDVNGNGFGLYAPSDNTIRAGAKFGTIPPVTASIGTVRGENRWYAARVNANSVAVTDLTAALATSVAAATTITTVADPVANPRAISAANDDFHFGGTAASSASSVLGGVELKFGAAWRAYLTDAELLDAVTKGRAIVSHVNAGVAGYPLAA